VSSPIAKALAANFPQRGAAVRRFEARNKGDEPTNWLIPHL